jgi:tetratricopeptide (TPR) repeat protein
MKYGLILLIICHLLTSQGQQKQPKEKTVKSKGAISKNQTEDLDHTPEESRNERIFIDAQRMKMLGQYQGAIDLLEESIRLDPSNSAAMFELARLFYASKQDDKALTNIAQAVKLNPDNLWYNLVYAQVLVANNQDKIAITVYDKILQLEPREISYYYDIAQLYERTDQFNEAIAQYNHIEELFGIDDYLISQKERLYLNLKKTDQAVEEVQKLIQSDSSNPDYYNMLAELYMGISKIDKATEIYQSILVRFPDYPNALLAMADISYQRGEKKIAIDYTVKAFSNKDMSIDSKIKILYQYIQFSDAKKSEVNDAYRLADALIATYPTDAKAFAIYADLYHTFDQDSIALLNYKKSISFKNDIFSVWQQIFFISSDREDYTNLKTYADKAVELFPNRALPYFFSGVANTHYKIYDTAIIAYQTAFKMSVTDHKLQAQILSGLGDAYHELKLNTLSDSCYEGAIKLDPTNAYAMNNYSYYLSLRNEYLEKAKEYSAMSNNIEKTNASYMDTYAWILYQLKEYKSAKDWQEKALRNSDLSDPVMFDHYGDILYRLGDVENAVKSWLKAKEKGENSSVLNKKIAEKKINE